MATAGGAESGAAAAAATSWEEEREAKVKALLAQMTQQEKIMQIGQVDKTFLQDLNDIATLGFGSLISGGSGQVRSQLRWSVVRYGAGRVWMRCCPSPSLNLPLPPHNANHTAL